MSLLTILRRVLSLPDGGADKERGDVRLEKQAREEKKEVALEMVREELRTAANPADVDVERIVKEVGLEPAHEDFSDLLGFDNGER